jgi:adenylosuccinate synthase
MVIQHVDICCGLNWGDEAKGKVIACLAKSGKYDMVCRWAGGNNAGHTIYKDGHKYKTHLVPCGIFYNVPSIIGPDCVVNVESFFHEVDYLKGCGFDTSYIKISPKAHIVTTQHIDEDKKNYSGQGTTCRGIAPCYRDKYARVGIRAKDVDALRDFMWDEELSGTILCEGAQGFWLDITRGNYPYVTSSTTLPYGACSLGFAPQHIRNIYGATKIYDTRSGIDPDFPEELLDDAELARVGDVGREYGTTTGRRRKVQWLNLDKLMEAIRISGTTIVIISKMDVLEEVGLYKLIYDGRIEKCESMEAMKRFISAVIADDCYFVKQILFSSDVETVQGI